MLLAAGDDQALLTVKEVLPFHANQSCAGSSGPVPAPVDQQHKHQHLAHPAMEQAQLLHIAKAKTANE